MIIIGVDFHPEFQQIALVDKDTGEFQGRSRSASRAVFAENEHGPPRTGCRIPNTPVQRTAAPRPALAQRIFSTEPNFNFL
jgi:hypothetical protein